MEVRVVDVGVPPDLAPGVVKPHLVAPGELQHRNLAQAPLAPSPIMSAAFKAMAEQPSGVQISALSLLVKILPFSTNKFP